MSKTYRNTPYKKMTQGYPIVKNKKNERKMVLTEALNELSEDYEQQVHTDYLKALDDYEGF